MLKKFLIGTIAIAALAFAMTASAADFGSTTLKVGSKGEAVKAVQTLVGASPIDGIFGPMTKAKVMAWQASNGLTADGLFGSMSKAKAANGNSVVGGTTLPAGCSAGAMFSSTTGASCTAVVTTLPAGCSAGAMFSSTTGASCTGAIATVSSNGEGSVTVTYDAVPANNLSIKHGDNKSVMALKIKATGSDMKVSRLWLDINKRIWLAADSASLSDGSTTVTLPLNSSTVTETTAGSQWQIQFNGLNVVVPVGTTKVLTLSINRPTLTSDNFSVNVLNTSSIRATDMAGISTSYPLTARIINLSDTSAATVGTLTATLNSSNSPAIQSVSGLSSTTGVLTAVKLMDFDLKATDGPINITDISGTAATISGSTCTVAQCAASFELRDGTNILASVTGGTTFDFSALNIDVAQDTTKTLSVFAQINPISATLVAGDGVTVTVTTVTATSGPSFTDKSLASQTVTSNAQYFYKYAPTFTLGTGTLAPTGVQADESTSTTVQKGANYSLAFTVAAPSGSDIYVDTANLVVTKSVFATGATIAPTTSVSGVSSKGSGTTAAYDKVAAGTSRTFTITGYVAHGGTTAGYTSMNLTSIPWSADVSTAAASQSWGLSDFKTPSVYVSL